MGNLTRDPELRYTPKGTPVASFGLAVNRNWKDENGQLVTDTLFADISAFGNQADVIGRYLRKGRPVFIEGRLKLDTWDDKQTGLKRSKITVVLESFQFIDSKNNDGSSDQGGGFVAPQQATPPSYAQQRPAQQSPYGGGLNAARIAPQPFPATPQTTTPPPAPVVVPPPMGETGQDDDVPF